jgi:hypothetical protein
MKKNYDVYTTDDFINDESFVRWVIGVENRDDCFWEEYRSNHSEQKLAINNAIKFIRSMKADEPEVDPRRFDVMWKNIKHQKSAKYRKIVMRRLISVAAVVVLIIAATYTYQTFIKPAEVNFEELTVENTKAVQVVLGDGSVKSLSGAKSQIMQENDGTLVANSDTIENPKDENLNTAMNKLVVPYGKQTDLYLSDGTHIYINSGSKLVFPSVFKGKRREIFLEGEAYCEVAADAKHPFVIHTPDIDVRVTGTAFNIQAYSNEKSSHTVLVHGKVTLISQHGLIKQKQTVNPGEKVSFNKSTGNFSSQEVETEQYTSWINGYLILQQCSVEYVFRCLERYYDTSIKYQGDLRNITFSGKLDLTDDISEVLGTIGFASSLNIQSDDEGYQVTKKE